MMRRYKLSWLKYDISAGLAVFFVALPLCLGIALASGAPLYAGILSGIIGGVVVSLISGSNLSVSGPAAGLSTVVAASIISLGDYRLFLPAVIIAGVLQLLLGIFRLGSLANYFPSSVIKGMLAAIGIILILNQIPIALGYDQPDFWTSGLIQLLSAEHFLGNLQSFNTHITRGAILISGLCLLVVFLFRHPVFRVLKVIPVPLFIVLIGVISNIVFLNFTSVFSLKPTQLVQIPDNIFAEIIFPDISQGFLNPDIWQFGLVIGLLATLETLLCIEAVDKLDKRNRITPVNRELVAQGIGNISCGLLGAIPITAVVVRGSANADAGARSKLSAFMHGIFLLSAVLFLSAFLNMIPYASLAAILIMTGLNLSPPKLYRNMWKLGLRQFLPFIITIVTILLTDLLVGVCIGLLISIYFIVMNNFKAEYHITKTVRDNVEMDYIRLNTNVTFLNKVKLKKALDKIPENSTVVIDGTDSSFIDYDILECISAFESKATERNITLILQGIERVSVTAIH